jgi:hypothetical protein
MHVHLEKLHIWSPKEVLYRYACGYRLRPGNKYWKQHTRDLDVLVFFQAMAIRLNESRINRKLVQVLNRRRYRLIRYKV